MKADEPPFLGPDFSCQTERDTVIELRNEKAINDHFALDPHPGASF